MSQRVTKDEIYAIAQQAYHHKLKTMLEQLKVFSGTSDQQKPLLDYGFKIKHDKSGLMYTVLRVWESDDGHIFLICKKPNGENIKIPNTLFKNYSRL